MDFQSISNLPLNQAFLGILVVIVGLSLGYFFGNQFANSQKGYDWSKSAIISEDPNFTTVDSFTAEERKSDPLAYEWFPENLSDGKWEIIGFGGKPPGKVLYNTNESRLMLHDWTRNPQAPENWHDSNISRNVFVPENVTAARAVAKVKSGTVNIDWQNYSCLKTKASLQAVKISQENNSSGIPKMDVVKKSSEIVSTDEKSISIGLNRFKGEEIGITVSTSKNYTCNSQKNWLQVNFLGVEVIKD